LSIEKHLISKLLDVILASYLGPTPDPQTHYKTARGLLSALPFRQIGGYNIAIQSAQNYRALRKSAVTVRKPIDVIIGTFCIMEGLPLLHDDRDFDPMVSRFSLRRPSPR